MAGRLTLLALLTLGLAAWVGGCSDSGSTSPVIDTAPPAVPDGLAYSLAQGAVSLVWAPNNTDADFVGFLVDRTTGDTRTALVNAPQNITSYQDDDPPFGVNTYWVSAVDQAGNTSAYAKIRVVIVMPSRPDGLQVD
jgi:hypothetical protein